MAASPKLWASIHIAGGFAFAPIEKSDKALLMGQIESNLVSAYLCCRAAVGALRKAGGGRIVNVAARPRSNRAAVPSMTAYTASKAGRRGAHRRRSPKRSRRTAFW